VKVVAIDGEIVPPERAVVSVYDRGFLYGDAVFEVLRTYGGKPFALDEHCARLRRSAERVLIPVPLDDAALAREIERVVAAAQNTESYARIMLTRGSGPLGLDPALAGAPLRVIIVEPVAPPPREVYAKGIALACIATSTTTSATAAAGAKVSNYLSNLLAVRDAKARGAAEALIVDAAGDVVEGASSNVFIVRRNTADAPPTLVTPPEDAGILAGITRAHVLAAAASLAIPVELTRLRPSDLYAADEAFITSSIREIVPAIAIDGRVIGAGTPGPVTRALHRAFREGVGLGGSSMPWEA
jgi:branched-chain amino acid aminotransferase